MSEAYVECLVKAKQSVWAKVGIALLIVLTVIFTLGMIFHWLSLLMAVITGLGAYLLRMFSDLEFEYLYLDKELSVDKVYAKSRRKRVATYDLDRIEILAPVNSYHLDNYKNRKVTTKDYSIREVLQPDQRYAMFYEGGEKIILNPSEEMIRVMRNVAPRKVFAD